MEQIVFKNRLFYYLLLSYLIILICWNSYTVIKGALIGILPIVIQLILLYLILDKNKLTKQGIKFWSIVLIIGSTLSIAGKLLKSVAGTDLDLKKLVENILMLTIGLLIFYYNDKTVEIEKVSEKELA
jgi:chromosome condensin MukBEF MukE localization factor